MSTPAPPTSPEQRRHIRRALQVVFRGREAEASGELLFEGADLSAGGAFLRSDLLLEQGESLAVEFRVAGLTRLLKAQARVAWVRRFPEPDELAGMGVQFLAMSEEDRAALLRHLGEG